jgi:hypothetical protein
MVPISELSLEWGGGAAERGGTVGPARQGGQSACDICPADLLSRHPRGRVPQLARGRVAPTPRSFGQPPFPSELPRPPGETARRRLLRGLPRTRLSTGTHRPFPPPRVRRCSTPPRESRGPAPSRCWRGSGARWWARGAARATLLMPRCGVRVTWCGRAGSAAPAARIHPALDAAPVVLDESAVQDATISRGLGLVDVRGSRWRCAQQQCAPVTGTCSRCSTTRRGCSPPTATLPRWTGWPRSTSVPAATGAKRVVGTNGPGTALATGAGDAHRGRGALRASAGTAGTARPCPSSDPGDGADRRGARPERLPRVRRTRTRSTWPIALGVAIEQTLTTREVRAALPRSLQSLQQPLRRATPATRDPALDRGGRIVGAFTPSVAPPLVEALAAEVRRAACQRLPRESEAVPVADRRPEGAATLVSRCCRASTMVGGCLVLAGGRCSSGSEGIPVPPGEVKCVRAALLRGRRARPWPAQR